MISLLEEAGHAVVSYSIVQDDYETIRETIYTAVSNPEIDVLLTGGTGISSRDTTYEAVSSLLDKELRIRRNLPLLSFTEDIGSAAILSRAIGGTLSHTAVSPCRVRAEPSLAMNRILPPELRHIKYELDKHRS